MDYICRILLIKISLVFPLTVMYAFHYPDTCIILKEFGTNSLRASFYRSNINLLSIKELTDVKKRKT
jgi:hypothetical protein